MQLVNFFFYQFHSLSFTGRKIKSFKSFCFYVSSLQCLRKERHKAERVWHRSSSWRLRFLLRGLVSGQTSACFLWSQNGCRPTPSSGETWTLWSDESTLLLGSGFLWRSCSNAAQTNTTFSFLQLYIICHVVPEDPLWALFWTLCTTAAKNI